MPAIQPASDFSTGLWTDNLGGASNVYAAIADSNDGTWAEVEALPFAGDPELPYTTELAAASDPGTDEGHEIRLRLAFPGGGSMPSHTMRCELLQGATVIDTFTSNLATSGIFQDVVRACPTASIANITSYASGLRLRFTLLPDTSGWTCQVAKAYLWTPTTFEHFDLDSGPGRKLVAAGSGNYLTYSSPGLRRVTGLETTGALIFNIGAPGRKAST